MGSIDLSQIRWGPFALQIFFKKMIALLESLS